MQEPSLYAVLSALSVFKWIFYFYTGQQAGHGLTGYRASGCPRLATVACRPCADEAPAAVGSWRIDLKRCCG